LSKSLIRRIPHRHGVAPETLYQEELELLMRTPNACGVGVPRRPGVSVNDICNPPTIAVAHNIEYKRHHSRIPFLLPFNQDVDSRLA